MRLGVKVLVGAIVSWYGIRHLRFRSHDCQTAQVLLGVHYIKVCWDN